MTFFQDLVVEMVFEGDDYRDGRRKTIRPQEEEDKYKDHDEGQGGTGGGHSLGCLMEWLSSSMVVRAAGQETENMRWTRSGDTRCFVHRPLTVLCQGVAGRNAICVSDNHRVFAQIVFIGAGEGQPGAEEQSSDVRDTSGDTLVRPTASLRPALRRHGHTWTIADWLVVLGPHKLGSFTDLTGFERQKDVSSVLVHTSKNLLCACQLNRTQKT